MATRTNAETHKDAIVLGFDYGTQRIGIALAETTAGSLRPLATVPCRDGRPDWSRIADLVDGYHPDLFIVGMPTSEANKTESLQTRIERFCRQLRGRYGRPVYTVDETLSSVEAAARGANERSLDAVAAQIILETWMNQTA
jgi:putative Holliday junction resolvase